MPDCTFDDSDGKHIYRIDGIEVPSVTQVLEEAGIVNTHFYTEEAKRRGQAVHMATEIYDKGEPLDWDALGTWPIGDGVQVDLVPYVEAWKAFRGDSHRLELVEIETPRYSPAHYYAGTPDRVANWCNVPCVLDIKTGSHAEWHRLQLAGYSGMMAANLGSHSAVLLKPNGTYSLKSYDVTTDMDAFRGALAVCHWKRNHK